MMKHCKLVHAYIAAIYLPSGVVYTLYCEYRHKKTAKTITTCLPVKSFQDGQDQLGEFQRALKLKY